ncbi:2-amino-4-hydroxy-6-hydroxymethyldihydropteridine diphosphokinase [Candidatus Margulisiibacteriota bacterium]
MNLCIVGTGSNINPENNTEKARMLIEKKHKIIKSSKFIKTKPIGNKNQADFLNGAWLVETNMEKSKFINFLKNIEIELGRKKGKDKCGPRCIDLDVVVWNGEIVDDDYYEREFLRNVISSLGVI